MSILAQVHSGLTSFEENGRYSGPSRSRCDAAFFKFTYRFLEGKRGRTVGIKLQEQVSTRGRIDVHWDPS